MVSAVAKQMLLRGLGKEHEIKIIQDGIYLKFGNEF